MFRSTALFAALIAAGTAPGQAGLMTRTDGVPDTVQATFQGRSSSISNRVAAVLAAPSQTQPDYAFGTAMTTPTTGSARPVLFNDLFNRNAYGGFNILRGIVVNASGHSFTIPTGAGAFSISGPVRFQATYRSTGISQRYVFFTSAPTAQIAGPTCNLTARLSSTRMGQFSPPTFNVSGFYTDQTGVHVVNQTTPVGGITYNTFLATAPASFSIPASRLTVPSNRVTVPGGPGANPVTTEFRATYQLSLQQ